jgi:hypothetical protein
VRILSITAAYKIAVEGLATVNGIWQGVFLPLGAAISGIENFIAIETARLEVIVLSRKDEADSI